MAISSTEFEIDNGVEPRILPMPLQLVREGETLGFTLTPGDADGDAIQLALLHDATTPAGVHFNPQTGYFEWTPSQDFVENTNSSTSADSQPYRFTFTAHDGTDTTRQSVQVQVFDVNRTPSVLASNHALVVGQAFSLPVWLGQGDGQPGIHASDPDGASQTQALTLRFSTQHKAGRFPMRLPGTHRFIFDEQADTRRQLDPPMPRQPQQLGGSPRGASQGS